MYYRDAFFAPTAVVDPVDQVLAAVVGQRPDVATAPDRQDHVRDLLVVVAAQIGSAQKEARKKTYE